MPTATSLLRRAYRKVRPHGASRAVELERLFFLHIPKCGGTSIDAALLDAYRAAGALSTHLDPRASARAAEAAGENIHDFRHHLLLYYMASRARHLSGHFRFSETARGAFEEWRYVTVLRDPVKRWLSNFFFNKYKDDGHFQIDEPIERFIESERAEFYGWNYVSCLTDRALSASPGTEEAIERAVANVEAFAVVGVLERLDVFTADCERYFGVSLNVEHRNRSPHPAGQQREELSDEMHERIRALCEPNRRVYDAARARIDRHGSWLTAPPSP